MAITRTTIKSLLFVVCTFQSWILLEAFVLPISLERCSCVLSASNLKTTLQPTAAVETFEKWFREQGNTCDDRIQHGLFGSLRGLVWKGEPLTERTQVASIRASSVLSTDYTQQDWDVRLAMQLLNRRKNVSGYYNLLKDGTESTAPNALRRWSLEQREGLTASPSGQLLLELLQQQENNWKQKHFAVQHQYSYEEFEWAMEVVYSRAFCGLGSVTAGSLVPAVAGPVVAAVAGAAYASTLTAESPDGLILAALGMIAVVPGLFAKDTPQVVLLPLIDSANHIDTADSSIEFDPISQAYQLTVGPNCFVADKQSQQTQLFVSYGDKSDAELLLNYGFLPSVQSTEGTVDQQRKQLAEAYLSRNKL